MYEQTLKPKFLIGIQKSADVASAALLMLKKNIGALGVYSSDGHELLGIVTDRDVTHAVAKGLDPSSTNVTEVMSDSVISIAAPVTRAEAMAIMHERHIRHLVVRVAGGDRIASIRDL